MELLHTFLGSGPEAVSWWQMCVRAVLVFAFAIVLFRLAPRRSFGKSSVFDVVLAVILGSMLSRTLTSNAPLLPTFAASIVLVVLHALVAFVAFRWSGFGRVLKGGEVVLVREGRYQRDAMRKAQLTERDLGEAIRLGAGISDVEAADTVTLERSGEISVVCKPSERR